MLRLFLVCLLVTACLPVRSQTGKKEPVTATPSYTPRADDARLMRGRAFVDEANVANGKLRLAGNIPTPCHQLRVNVPTAPGADGVLAVEAYSVFDRTMICAQVLQPFTVEVPLTTAQGRARITVNGTQVGPVER